MPLWRRKSVVVTPLRGLRYYGILRIAILIPIILTSLVFLSVLGPLILVLSITFLIISLFLPGGHRRIGSLLRAPFTLASAIARSIVRVVSLRYWLCLQAHEKFSRDCTPFPPPPHMEHNIELGRTLTSGLFGSRYRKVGIFDGELLRGVCILGGLKDQSIHVNKLIVHDAEKLGVNYVVFDVDNRYRNLLYGCRDAKVLRLGVNLFVNPFERSGMGEKRFANVLADIFCSAYELGSRERNLLCAAMLKLYEKAGRKRVSPTDRERLEGAISRIEGVPTAMQEIRQLFDGLTELRTAEALGETLTPPIKAIFENGTVIVELGGYDQQFKSFIQVVLLARYLAYRERSTSAHPRSVILIDEAHRLFPDPRNLPSDVRMFRRRVCELVNELSERGVGIHISTPFPSEVDPTVLGTARTLIVYRVPDNRSLRSLRSLLGLSQSQTGVLLALGHHEGLLARSFTAYEGVLPIIHSDLPEWIFRSPPSDEEIGLVRGIRAIEVPTAAVRRTALEEDLGKDAEDAYLVLGLLTEYGPCTLDGFAAYVGELPGSRVRQLCRELERLGYVRFAGERRELNLTQKGIEASSEWGERRFVKLSEFEIEKVPEERLISLASRHPSFKHLLKAERACGSWEHAKSIEFAYDAVRTAMKETYERSGQSSGERMSYQKLVKELGSLGARPLAASELFHLRNLRRYAKYGKSTPGPQEAERAVRIAKEAVCRIYWKEVMEGG